MPDKPARTNVLVAVNKGGYEECADCGGLIDTEYEWLGENQDGVGVTRYIDRCMTCGRWREELVKGG